MLGGQRRVIQLMRIVEHSDINPRGIIVVEEFSANILSRVKMNADYHQVFALHLTTNNASSFRLDEALGVADGVHHLNEKTFSNCSQLLQVCQGASPDKSENSIITSWTSDSDETQRPFMRGCWRYCEWGPIKGHVTYHKTD